MSLPPTFARPTRWVLALLAGAMVAPALASAAHAVPAPVTPVTVTPVWTAAYDANHVIYNVAADARSVLWEVQGENQQPVTGGVQRATDNLEFPAVPKSFDVAGLTFDAAGRSYVLGCPAGAAPTDQQLDVFAADAPSGSAPLRVITGPRTGLSDFCLSDDQVVVSPTGSILVYETGRTEVFRPGASGNAAPAHVYTADQLGISDAGRFGPVGGSWATDAKGNLYIATTHGFTVFSWNRQGRIARLRSVAGAGTGLGAGTGTNIAVDARGDVYATSDVASAPWADDRQIEVFAPGASGNTAPLGIYRVAGTGLLGGPYGTTGLELLVARNRAVYAFGMSDASWDTVLKLKPLVTR